MQCTRTRALSTGQPRFVAAGLGSDRGPTATQGVTKQSYARRRRRYTVPAIRAQEDEVDEEVAFEKRLADLKRAKGETPYGESKKRPKEASVESADYTGETVFYEGSPHSGDLAINLLMGITVLWLPLTVASIGRKAFIKYKFTDKRISVSTSAPWQSNQTDVAYSQVRDVVALGRGVGLWGDMVITLKNGDKIELRSLDKWQEIKAYILEKKAEAEAPPAASSTGFSS